MKDKKISIDTYLHNDAKRTNNPPVGLVSSQTDRTQGQTKYQHDPHIDPYLSWAGKIEGTEFNVDNVSLHIHERIDPKRLVKAFLKREKEGPKQISLFEQPQNEPPLSKAIDFYSHDQDWTNRLIAGDSLLVMNSLLQKEGMAGKVQMIYIDPPYGIKYNSNFQPFVNKRDVKDNNDDDIPAEPEMIKAFRDTWELGIHSYLKYLYDRLLMARELLSESGSCFVQINDENVHYVRELMDEVFGRNNFFSAIAVKKTVGLGSSGLTGTLDYLIWYTKDKKSIKFRQLYSDREIGDGTGYTWIELADNSIRRMTRQELNNPKLSPEGAKAFCAAPLMSSGYTSSCTFDFPFEGRTISAAKYSWKTNKNGVEKLIDLRRIIRPGSLPNYKMYASDYPVQPISNYWGDVRASDMMYVVQTANKVLQRCILMTTDPGDLVFDPTCGSGTTAFVAEQWGRRWMTCDTSRVAITLAKQRMMTGKFDYYKLAHPEEGIKSGFEYKKVPHITLGSIANNEPTKEETLYDQPFADNSKIRVAGPFTVEAVPSIQTKPFDGSEMKVEGFGSELARSGKTGKEAHWRDELKATGIRATGGNFISFARIEPMLGTKYLHAEGEITDKKNNLKKAVISFGPEFGPLEQRQVEEALKEARSLSERPQFVIFAAFQFDPEAAKDIDQIEWGDVKILKAQMSADLLTEDLRKKRSSNQSFWLIGQPDIDVEKTPEGQYKVTLNGFDYYNPLTGEIESGGVKRIAMWMLDTDYDERSIFPSQIFFPMSDQKRDWTRLAKSLNGDVDENLLEAFTGIESLTFDKGINSKIAVKIIDDRGIESFVIKKL